MVNGLVYGVIIYGAYRAIVWLGTGRILLGIVAAAIACAPIAHYLNLKSKLKAEIEERQARLENMSRKPIQDKGSVKTIELKGSSAVLVSELISTGALDQVVDRVNQSYGAELSQDCRSQAKTGFKLITLLNAAKARQAFLRCAKKINKPESEPQIVLYSDRYAPSRNRKCGGNVSGGTLELRWSTRLGGELIAFKERSYAQEIGAMIYLPEPPFIPVHCKRKKSDTTSLQTVPFIWDGLGYASIEELPRLASSDQALATLRWLLDVEIQNDDKQSANSVILMLGQWQSTPQSSMLLREKLYSHTVAEIFNQQVHLNNDTMLPQLKTHRPDIVALCDDGRFNKNVCSQLKLP